jgi:hypothetical protein
MTQVILQPSANKGAREHYQDTIEHPVSLADNQDLLGTDLHNHLLTLFPDGVAAMWGVTPGLNGSNQRKWERMELGASVVFAADGRIFGRGVIAAKFHNPPLARRLWKEDDRGDTWEFMYALDQVTPVNIPYADFNLAVGYKPNNVIQGFTVLDEEKSELFLDAFPVVGARIEWPASPEEVEEARRELTGDLERRVEGWQRAEQSALREVLLRGRPTGECALCERTIDSRMLVAAHIKKRSECTDAEKRDLTNIGMLACRFGCDELYERGFISVGEDWTILIHPSVKDAVVRGYITNTVRTSIKARPGSSVYFKWHRLNHHFD